MSVSICRHLCDSEKFAGVNPHDRYFLLFLAFNAEEDGSFRYPATKLIAMLGGVSRGSFYKQVSRLEKAGYLTRQDGKLRLSARLVADGDSDVSPTATATVAVSDRGCRQGRLSSSPTPPLSLNKTIKTNNQDYSIDPPIIPPSKDNATYDLSRNSWEAARLGYSSSAKAYRSPTGRPDFITQGCTQRPTLMSHIRNARQAYNKEQLAFVKAYPKTEADPSAFLEAWSAVVESGVKEKDLVRAAKDYADKMTYDKDDGNFIQTPENWLTRKGYAVYVRRYEEERAQQQRYRAQNNPSAESDIADFDPFDTTGFSTDKE